MPTSITASSSQMLGTIQVPLDGVDNVAQASVSPGYQGILNNTYYLAKSLCYQRPHVSMSWTTTTSLTVNSFSGVWVSATTPAEQFVYLQSSVPIVATTTNLEGGGTFANSTLYYVYVYGTGLPASPQIQISTTAPDAFLSFKNADESKRYLGHFVTDGSAHIVPFTMIDYEYFMSPPLQLLNVALMAGGTTVTNDIQAPTPFPASIKEYGLKMDVDTTETTVCWIYTAPKGVTPVAGVSEYDFFKDGTLVNFNSFFCPVAAGVAGKVTVSVNTPAPITGVINADIRMISYKE